MLHVCLLDTVCQYAVHVTQCTYTIWHYTTLVKPRRGRFVAGSRDTFHIRPTDVLQTGPLSFANSTPAGLSL